MVERAYMNHWIKGRKLRINDSSRLIAAPAHMVMIWGLEENELEEENKMAKNVSEKKERTGKREIHYWSLRCKGVWEWCSVFSFLSLSFTTLNTWHHPHKNWASSVYKMKTRHIFHQPLWMYNLKWMYCSSNVMLSVQIYTFINIIKSITNYVYYTVYLMYISI